VTPEEESCDVRELVWGMSRMTKKILIFGIVLILAILAALIYLGILTMKTGRMLATSVVRGRPFLYP